MTPHQLVFKQEIVEHFSHGFGGMKCWYHLDQPAHSPGTEEVPRGVNV